MPGAVLVTKPKLALFALQQIVFGGPNCVRLKRLKNSTRASTAALASGPKKNRLKIAKSKLSTPSERKEESTRDSFPKLKFAGAAKQEVLNQPSRRSMRSAPDVFLHPSIAFGRG